MSDIEKMQTKTRIYYENGTKFSITARYGMHKIGEQIPYFSITADVYYQSRNHHWCESSFGCQHELIARIFPELAPLIRFHLCDQDGTPMHYLVNAEYYYEQICCADTEIGEYKESLLEIVQWDGDFMSLGVEIFKFSSIKDFLKNRLPWIQSEFYRTMQEFGVEFIQ